MPSNVWVPMLTNHLSLCSKSLWARMKVAHVKLYQEDTRLVPQYAGTATCGNRPSKIQKLSFVFLKKKANSRNNFITQWQMRYVIYMPLNAAKIYDRPNDACLWKLAKRNKVCTSKQLQFVARAETMETRFYTIQSHLFEYINLICVYWFSAVFIYLLCMQMYL